MNAWRSMKDLLEAENRALAAGRLGDLDALRTRKEDLLPRLTGAAPDALTQEVRALAERNADLLDATARGVKAALQQVSEARLSGGLRTYDDAGAAVALGAARRSVERKA